MSWSASAFLGLRTYVINFIGLHPRVTLGRKGRKMKLTDGNCLCKNASWVANYRFLEDEVKHSVDLLWSMDVDAAIAHGGMGGRHTLSLCDPFKLWMINQPHRSKVPCLASDPNDPNQLFLLFLPFHFILTGRMTNWMEGCCVMFSSLWKPPVRHFFRFFSFEWCDGWGFTSQFSDLVSLSSLVFLYAIYVDDAFFRTVLNMTTYRFLPRPSYRFVIRREP